MKRVFALLIAVAAVAPLAIAQEAPPAAPPPIAVEFGADRVSLNWLSDSRIDMAALSYDFKAIGPRLDLAGAYLTAADGTDRQYLGAFVRWTAYDSRQIGVSVTAGLKGLDLTPGRIGRLDVARNFVYGVGLTFKFAGA